MDPVASIALWAILFVGSHLVISSTGIRPWLIAKVGEQPYRGIYSLISFGTLIPLIIVFANHKHSGAMLWYLRAMAPVRGLTWLLMVLAFIMLVSGLVTPSPAGMGTESESKLTPRGLLKLSRHPLFVGLALFGIAHMLMNGWVGDVIFFGTFPLLGIVGAKVQDTRKLREFGESYRKFMSETSLFPGIALISGRQKWTAADVPWTGILVGIALAIVTVVVHPWLFGGQPLG
jgi:uncharacterized membrane protein